MSHVDSGPIPDEEPEYKIVCDTSVIPKTRLGRILHPFLKGPIEGHPFEVTVQVEVDTLPPERARAVKSYN